MMIQARGIVRNEIVRLLRGLKRKDSPLQGPARDAAMKKLKELRQRERRLMKTASQKIAAQIADQAKRNGAGVWQMEDLSLTDMKEGQPWLARNWAAGMLIDAIRWQAAQAGADLQVVDPRCTSQRCSQCGHIDRENRPKAKKGAAYFKCTNESCGHEDNADKNAARNLSIIGIDKLIAVRLNN
jgi:IS605 OrfB family transposase